MLQIRRSKLLNVVPTDSLRSGDAPTWGAALSYSADVGNHWWQCCVSMLVGDVRSPLKALVCGDPRKRPWIGLTVGMDARHADPLGRTKSDRPGPAVWRRTASDAQTAIAPPWLTVTLADIPE